ncbi:MAG: S-layer homology domain-containing protein [Clostridia bacterium]|nr:S-layer homology domain-containing protein [Clostridia bacterium]
MKTNKKIISVALALIMILSVLPMASVGASAATVSFKTKLCAASEFAVLYPGEMEVHHWFSFKSNGNVVESVLVNDETGQTRDTTYKYTIGKDSENVEYATFGSYKLVDNQVSEDLFLCIVNLGNANESAAAFLNVDAPRTKSTEAHYGTRWSSPHIINAKNNSRAEIHFPSKGYAGVLTNGYNVPFYASMLSDNITNLYPKSTCGITQIVTEFLSPLQSFSIIFFDDGDYVAEVWDRHFPDVKMGSWYYDAVMINVEQGILSGYVNGYFGPNDNLKRQDFVVMIANLVGADLSKYQNATPKLKDVKKGAYYAAAVNWAVDNGIIAGYANGKFGVGDNITREQICTILYRMFDSPSVSNVSGTLAGFSDRRFVSSFATNAVAWAVQNKIISGMSDGRLAPTSTASRAQIAMIMLNLITNDSLFD